MTRPTRRKFLALMLGPFVPQSWSQPGEYLIVRRDRSIRSQPTSTASAPTIANVRTFSSSNQFFSCLNGGSTSSNHLNVHGASVYVGATVSIYLDGSLKGTTTATSSNWAFDLGLLSDGSHTIYATQTYGGGTSNPSSNFTFTVTAGLTSLPRGIGGYILNTETFYCDGTQVVAVNDPSSHVACVIYDTHQLDITLAPGDLWPGNNSNRSEVSMYDQSKGDGTTFNVTYEFLLSASSPINDDFGYGKWCIVGQLGDVPSAQGGPAMEINLGGDSGGAGTSGDQLSVDAAVNGTISNFYRDPSGNISRGVWHTVDIIMMPSQSAGFIQVWIDGVQVVNQTGFYGAPGYWWKVGLYRGTNTSHDQTQIARYRNLQMKLT